MSYLGTKPQTATEVADGVVTPSDLSTGHPTWDTSGNLTLDNGAADGAQLVLKSAGYSSWNIDNYSGSLRAYYNATEYMRIDSSGNVGIGVTPSAWSLLKGLQVVNANFAGYSNRAYVSANAYFNGSGWVYQATDYANAYMQQLGQHQWYNAPSGTAGNAISFTQAMTLDSSGRLLVGLTSLPVSSSKINIGFNNNSSSYALNVYHQSSSYNDSALVFYSHSNSVMGYIYCNGSSTQYATSSDYRLKENIAPMTGALAKVQLLKPCTYTWKETGRSSEGFIAHELQEVVPECVTGEKDAVNEDGSIKPQGIDTSFLVATLTAAIQEQQAIITSLEARLTALESK